MASRIWGNKQSGLAYPLGLPQASAPELLADPTFQTPADWTDVGTGSVSGGQLNTGTTNGSGASALGAGNAVLANYTLKVNVVSFPSGVGTANLWVTIGYPGNDAAYVNQFVTVTGQSTITFAATNNGQPIKVSLLSNGSGASGAAIVNSASLKRSS